MRFTSKNKVEAEIERRTSYPPIYESGSFFQRKGSSFSSSGDSDYSVNEVEGFYFYFKQLVLILINQRLPVSLTESWKIRHMV